MNKILLVVVMSLGLFLTACGGTKQESSDKSWSKPQRVLEGCDGSLSNSKQCQKNPNSQQLMIQIDRN